MRRFRQWLAEKQDHMTESPDGKWALYAEALADKEAVKNEMWDLAHEPAKCGHARANWKDPKYGTPEYQGKERCEVCEQIAALTESRDYWKREWRLMEVAQGEISRLYAITVEQSKQIAALNDALSGRDGIIEKLKGYLANKKTDIAEKVEYINSLTAELKSLTGAYNNTDWKKRTDVLIEAIKLAYRKHHLNDDTIGWEELSEALLNSLCETMGDKGYQDWMGALNLKGKEVGDE